MFAFWLAMEILFTVETECWFWFASEWVETFSTCCWWSRRRIWRSCRNSQDSLVNTVNIDSLINSPLLEPGLNTVHQEPDCGSGAVRHGTPTLDLDIPGGVMEVDCDATNELGANTDDKLGDKVRCEAALINTGTVFYTFYLDITNHVSEVYRESWEGLKGYFRVKSAIAHHINIFCRVVQNNLYVGLISIFDVIRDLSFFIQDIWDIPVTGVTHLAYRHFRWK